MAITLRNTKGSALTYSELDGNFTDLNGRIFDSNAVRNLIDSDYVQLRQADIFRDSGFVSDIIDSDYIHYRVNAGYVKGLADSAYITSIVDSNYVQSIQDIRDSAFVTGIVNSSYIQANQNIRDSAFVTNIVDSDYVNLRVDTVTYLGFDSDFNSKTTSDLTEGTNLYYTNDRVDTQLGTKTSDNISEGATNLYYTAARFDSNFANKTTDGLTEGSTNLFYTSGRVDSDISFLVDSSYVSLRETITLATLQTELSASDSFGAFKLRIAAL